MRQALLPAFLLACGGSPPPPALAVGDVGYSNLELGALSARQRQRLSELTAFALAVGRGEADRLASALADRDQRELLVRKLALAVAAREAGIAEAELRAAYLEDPEYELIVRHLVVLSERWRSAEDRLRASSRADSALRRIRGGEEFTAVAAEVSDEPGAAARGGLLRPGREGSWVPEFWAAAAALELGAISGVVETEYGFHVLRLDDRRPIPFEEVRDRTLERLVDPAAAAVAAEEWAEQESALLAQRAESLGVRLDSAEAAAIEAQWRHRLDGWASLFRFRSGATVEEIKAAALTALTSTQQSVQIARDELGSLGPVLRSAYPVVEAPPATGPA